MNRWTITLPTAGNHGEDLTAAHATLRRNIAKTGGFTATEGQGSWPSSDGETLYYENVIVYTFDREDTFKTIEAHAMAAVAKVMANQEGVYVTHTPTLAWVL